VVDIGLPGLSGVEVARQLRRNPATRQLHLIALTGYGREEDRTSAMSAGFDEHLRKPADLDELLKLILRGRVVDAPAIQL
jgi:CheY-like chemotaxis protein